LSTDMAAIAHRLDALEASLVKSGALIPADLEHFLRSLRGDAGGPVQPTNDKAGEASRPSTIKADARPTAVGKDAPRADQDPDSDTEGAALTLEHLAFGRSKMDGSHAIPHFAHGRISTVSKTAPNNSYHLARAGDSPSSKGYPAEGMWTSPSGPRHGSGPIMTEAKRRGSALGVSEEERAKRIDELLDLVGPTDVFDMVWRKTDLAMRALTKLLPSRERGELLVKTVSRIMLDVSV
jgi:hypothetical protein